jgi:hypothetical protein
LPLGEPFFERAARSAGESVEGGLLEFDEFSPRRRRSSAFSSSRTAIRASNASTWASRRALLSSAGVTHTLDHTALPLSIPSCREEIRTPPRERVLQNFVANIWTHLKKGFAKWLFGSLADAGIQILTDPLILAA